MKRFKLEIACDNAAFVEGGSPEYELSRILRDLSRKLEHARADEGVLRDINGNKVGTWRLENG